MTLGSAARVSREATLRRGALRVRLGASGVTRTVRITALAGRTRVASRRIVLQAGPARFVRVPLTAAGRRLLRADRRVPLRLVVRAADTRERLAIGRTVVR